MGLSVRRMVKRIRMILGQCLLLGSLTVVYFWLYYHAPAGRDTSTQIIEVPFGASLQQIATQLADAGLVRHRWMFVLYAAWLSPGPHLQSGEYALQATLSPVQIVDIMRRGKVSQHVFPIPEGLTLRDLAALIEAKGLGQSQRILDLAQDTSFIATLGLAVPSLEGYLFPANVPCVPPHERAATADPDGPYPAPQLHTRGRCPESPARHASTRRHDPGLFDRKGSPGG
ncbi:Endolytic murein transglycosylase [Candidatus Entotheonellaceae bacterium PAL068K]